MKSQIKDIVIGIFAVIGFTAIVMGFNNPAEPQQETYATPESHVWETVARDMEDIYLLNKVTGEIRMVREYMKESYSLNGRKLRYISSQNHEE